MSFYKASDNHICEELTEYDCEGAAPACGADVLERSGIKTCQGNTSDCTDPSTDWGSGWSTIEVCGENDICVLDGANSRCSTCAKGCSSVTGACNTDCNPALDETCCGSDGKWKSYEVHQPGTDLFWLTCPLDQNWESGPSCGCTGTLDMKSWSETTTSCPPGYRLPTRQEFIDILGNCDADVKNNKVGFCDTCESEDANSSDICTGVLGSDSGHYWTSSSVGGGYIWIVYLDTGEVTQYPTVASLYVRCVRSGS